MSSQILLSSSGVLLISLLSYLKTIWLESSNTGKSVFAILKNVRNNDWLSDSASTEETQGWTLFEKVVLLFSLIFFLLFSSGQKCCNIWLLHHEVDGVFTSTFELDRSWWLIAIKNSPLLSHLLVALEHPAIEFDKVFCDNRLIFSLSFFYTNHCWKRASSSYPLWRIWIFKVLDTRHVSWSFLHHKVSGILSKSIAILWIKVTRKSTSTLITKEMALWNKATIIWALCLSLFEFSGDCQNEESFSVNLWDLNVTMRISVEKKLAWNSLWKLLEKFSCLFL